MFMCVVYAKSVREWRIERLFENFGWIFWVDCIDSLSSQSAHTTLSTSQKREEKKGRMRELREHEKAFRGREYVH